MNVTINSNAFTKMDKMVGISVVEIKILDYYLQNRILKGNVKIYGEYYTEDVEFETSNGLKEFENIVPFEIVYYKEDPIIDNISIKNFEYYEVAGRGVESVFDLCVEYTVETEQVSQNEIEAEEIKEQVSQNEIEAEEIKEQVSRQIDTILEEKLEVRNDNFLEEARGEKQHDKMSIIKIVYYDQSKEVKEICKKYDVSYYDILEDNKKYNFNDNHRIVINGYNGTK